MHSALLRSLLVALGAAAALAQSQPYLNGSFHQTELPLINCGPDVIVDNFSSPHMGVLPLVGEHEPRHLDQLGGDYGLSSANMTLNITTSGASLTPTGAGAYFFFKLDAGACFDLTGFNSLVFDIIAPTGSNFATGLTQKTANCSERVGGESGSSDSPYTDLTKYITPNGEKQTVVLPFQNIKGTFDFAHLKDVTFINWTPLNANFVMSNIRLRRACNGNGPDGTNTTVSTGDDAALPSSTASAGAPGASGTSDGLPVSTSPTGAASQAGSAAPSNDAGSLAASGFAVGALLAGVLALL